MILTATFFITETITGTATKDITNMATMLKRWGTVLIGISYFLAVGYLTRTHVRHIVRRDPGQWIYSIVLLLVMIPFLLYGIVYGTSESNYALIWNNVYAPLNGAMFSYLAFYCVSAIYRTFRARTVETAILVVSGIIVLFTIVPLIVGAYPPLMNLGAWLVEVPNLGAMRALTVGGVGIGLALLSIRVIFGYERGWMGER